MAPTRLAARGPETISTQYLDVQQIFSSSVSHPLIGVVSVGASPASLMPRLPARTCRPTFPSSLHGNNMLLARLKRPTLMSIPRITVSPLQRNLQLAPPFLVEDYIPRYQLLSSVDASKKRSAAYAHLRNCNLCPRLCGVNRYERIGTCLIGSNVKVSVIAPHFGEGKYNDQIRRLV